MNPQTAAAALAARFAPAASPQVEERVERSVVRFVTVREANGREVRRRTLLFERGVYVDGVYQFSHFGERGGYAPCSPRKTDKKVGMLCVLC